MDTIQIRIDKKLKTEAKKILTSVGLDLSSAIKIYLKQIIIRKGLPFRVLTENGFTPEEENEILKRALEAEKGINLTKAMPAKKALKYLKEYIDGDKI